LARRLQMEELAAQQGDGGDGGGVPVRHAAEVLAGRAGRGADAELSDEALAILLQQEEVEAAGGPSDGHIQQLGPQWQAPGHEQRQQGPQARQPWFAESTEGCFSSGASSLPGLSALMRSGAFFGCCGGLQMAACLGCGHVATWLCALGGGVAGHLTNSGAACGAGPSVRGSHASRFEDEDDFYPDDSDEELPRGLDTSTIEGHTVDHVYVAPGAPQPVSHSALPGQRGQAGDGCAEEDRKCMVCMEAFAVGEPLRALPCLHRYHRQCIDEWLGRSRECPICKRDITAAAEPLSGSSSRDSRRRTARVQRLWNWRSS